MSVICTACGKTNRANAMFCGGCTGRLPAFAPTGPSALEAMKTWRSPTVPARTAGMAPAALPAETLAFWFRLGSIGLAMVTVFIVWYLYVTREVAPMPVRYAAAPAPTRPPVPERETALPPPAETLTATPAQAPVASAVGVRDAVDLPPLPALVATERSDGAAQAVANFYRALSAGDGATAAAFIVPGKRNIGTFNESSMSKFFGSFKEPLAVRSIRQIDRNVVEAKYSYRVSRTRCEGTAVIETESVRDQTLIRRIRANC